MPLSTRKKSGSMSSVVVDLTLHNYSQVQQSQGTADSNSIMYFVLPKDQTEETCSPALIAAYRLSDELGLNAKLTTEDELKAMKPKPGNVFVLDPFEGPAFKFLEQQFFKSKKFLVIGPQCIQYATQHMDSGTIQSKGYPFYIMSMRNICVTLSGFDKEEQAELSDLVQLMNGIVSKPFSVATTHVVAKNVITPKCFQAFKNEVPVMTAEWIRSVWKEGQKNIIDATDAKYIEYACGIFYNVNICVSQVPSNVKNVIEKIIVAGGGEYSKNFQRYKTDLLIVPHAGGDKYKYALEWKVPVVTPDWVNKSKEAGHVLPFDNFKPSQRPMLSSTQITDADPRMSHFDGVSVLSAIGDLSERSRIDSTGLTNVTILTNLEKEEVKREDLDALRNAPEGYLDGCMIYLCNHENEKLNVLRIILSGCAQRTSHLCDGITHVVVINDNISDKEIKGIKALGSEPYVVSMDWLLECAKQGSAVDPEPYAMDICNFERGSNGQFVLPRKQSSDPKLHKSPENSEPPVSKRNQTRNSSEKVEKNNTSVFQAPERVERANIVPNTEDPKPQPPPPENVTVMEEAEGNFLFTGLVFIVKLESAEETDRISRLIREAGGEVIGENEQSDDSAIPILPPVYRGNAHALEVFTKYWVEDALEQESLDIEGIHHKPFQANDSLKELFTGVVLAMSAYSTHIKEFIGTVASFMGATVQETFCRKNKDKVLRTTHLLCSVTDNDKFRAAQRWGTPVVLCEWIIESYKRGTLLDHTDFLLLGDSDSTSSVYMKTPKTQGDKVWRPAAKDNQTTSVLPGTDKAKAAVSKIPGMRKFTFGSDTDPTKPTTTTEGGGFKTPVPMNKPPVGTQVEESPLIRDWMSRSASRQLKRALDWAAGPSPISEDEKGNMKQPRKSTPLRAIMDDVDEILMRRAMEAKNANQISRATEARNEILKSPDSEPNVNVETNDEPMKDNGGVREPHDSGLGDKVEDVLSPEEEDPGARRSKRQKVMGISSSGFSSLGSRKGSTNSVKVSKKFSPTQGSKFGNILDEMVDTGKSNADEGSEFAWNPDADEAEKVQPEPAREPVIENPQLPSSPPGTTLQQETEEPKGFVKKTRGTSGSSNSESSTSTRTTRNKASGIPKVTQAKKKKTYCFAISGGTAQEKEGFKTVLHKFGATVSPADFYDKNADAVIATKVARSEKILGSIAGGKPILHPSYIAHCVEAGRLLEFDDHLWGEEHAGSENERTMARVAQHWYRRLKEDPSDSPYAKYVVCLCEEKEAKRNAYSRLIEAGGGRVATDEDDPDMNIVIGDGREAVRIAEEREVPHKIPMFLNDVIINYDDPRVHVIELD